MALTADLSPLAVRHAFRRNLEARPTAGLCPGFVQCNLIILPASEADDFRTFAARNPMACPLLEETAPGVRSLVRLAEDADVATDFPRYRVYRHGVLKGEPLDIRDLWRDDLVTFLIGCSFSFEEALVARGLPVRHIEENRNVPMYLTDIDCAPAGIFGGKMVVSMRPMLPHEAEEAAAITARMPRVHGGPVHVGDGRAIGIADVFQPDFGEAVTIRDGEVCVFWPCGVTPQSAVMTAKPPLAITHAPGHMLVCDVLNSTLMG